MAAGYLEYAYNIWDKEAAWDSNQVITPSPVDHYNRWMEERREKEKGEERKLKVA